MTIASALIPVLPTNGANALAIFTADSLHRQGKHDLFAEDILQLQSATLVKANFRLALIDGNLFVASDHRSRLVKQIEPGVQRKTRIHQATIAGRRKFYGISALNANFPAGIFQRFGGADGMQRGNLLQIFTGEFDLPGLESFVETNLSQLHLSDTKEHIDTLGLSGRTFTL
ncbi:MAG TPA: hypothetical protein VHW09_05930 [Bryobacteraceae bacterium]|nr:hypothetical protein [Bryobacteraceae bacterium]